MGVRTTRFAPSETTRTRDYADEHRSSIRANPGLQLLKGRHVDRIAEKVENVIDVKKENFKKTTDTPWAKIATIVALFALAAIALIAMHASGIGTFVGASMLVVGILSIAGAGLLAKHIYNNEEKIKKQREDAEDDINTVHGAAIRHFVTEEVDQIDREEGVEMGPAAGNRRRLPPGGFQPSAPRRERVPVETQYTDAV